MEPCLICGGGSDHQRGRQSGKGILADYFVEDNVDEVIKEQLWTIFILRRLLRLPAELCGGYLLQTFGLNPDQWFSLCEECSRVGRAAFGVYSRMLELERELEGLRGEVMGKLRRSLEKEDEQFIGLDREGEAQVFSVREEIRKYFKEVPQNVTVTPFQEAMDVDDGGEIGVGVVDSLFEGVAVDEDDDDDLLSALSFEVDFTTFKREPEPSPPILRKRRQPTRRGRGSLRQQEFRNDDDDVECPSDGERGDDDDDDDHPYSPSPPAASEGECSDFEVDHYGGSGGGGGDGVSENPKKNRTRRSNRINNNNNDDESNLSKSKEDDDKLKNLKYACDKCDFVAKNGRSKTRHLAQHKIHDNILQKSPNSKFQCQKCSQEFKNRKGAIQHVRAEHGAQLGLKLYPCQSCATVFGRADALADHVRSVHKNKNHSNSKRVSKPEPEDTDAEAEDVDDNDEYPLEEEGSDFEGKESASKKSRSRSSRSSAPNKSSQEKLENGNKYACDKCDFVAKDRRSKTRHLAQHKVQDIILVTDSSSSPKKTFQCKECHQDFKTRKRAIQHVRADHGAQLGLKLYPCPSCPTVFGRADAFADHIRRVHKDKKIQSKEEEERSSSKQDDKVVGVGESDTEEDGGVDVGDDDFEVEQGGGAPQTSSSKKGATRGSSAAAGAPNNSKEDLENYKYACDRCDYVAKDGRSKRRHLAHHKIQDNILQTDKSSFQCTLCNQEFQTHRKTLQHLRVEHGDQLGMKLYPCPSCPTIFERKDSLLVHSQSVHKKGSSGSSRVGDNDKEGYSCDKCDFAAKDERSKARHVVQHKVQDNILQTDKSPRSFQCVICREDFRAHNEAVQHVRIYHGEQLGIKLYPCPNCTTVFDRMDRLGVHIRRIHKKQLYTCDECGASYSQHCDFEDHQAKHANNERTTSICDICGLELSGRRTLQQHRKKFHSTLEEIPPDGKGGGGAGEGGGGTGVKEEIPSTSSSSLSSSSAARRCPLCDISVVHVVALKQHLRRAHVELYKFGCDSCDAIYMTRNRLETHKRAAHSEKVSCPHCNKAIGCADYLPQHWKKYCRNYPGLLAEGEPA